MASTDNALKDVGKYTIKLITEKLKEIQKHHYESTTPMDSYFTGMYNGLELAIVSIDGSEPNFKEVEKKDEETSARSN